MSSLVITGGCFCGRVRYRISAPLGPGRSCHCSRCRKAFSGAGSAYAEVAAGSFSWVSGEDNLSRFETTPGWGLCFCRTCGTTLCGTAAGSVHGVTLGSVDGDPGVQIEMHLFVGSKAPWDHIGGQAPQHQEFPPAPSSTPLLALATVLLPLLLLTNAPPALAQPAPTEVAGPSACPPSASRTRERCEPEATVVTLEQELNFSIELPPLPIVQCAAAIEIKYSQRDTVVRVEGNLDHEDCAASSGEYAVTVRVRDESREVKTLEFTETWQRADDQPVRLSADYPIGANVDLVAVRVQQSRCTCADEP